MTNAALVSVKNVSRYYGTHLAVDNISFSVQRGEVLGFLGPNGAGKSTTMQILTGNLAPSLGEICINGFDILDQPKEAKAELGYLAEQPPLYKELTVNEYLSFCAKLNRIPHTQVRSSIDNAQQRCGLEEVGKRLIGNLSKGFQQRVGIAQAIIHSPEVVILDEPTVGLDPIQIREIRHLIRELGQDHSVILSTHILPEVQATCDRVQIINHGKLILSDSVRGLQQRMQSFNLLIGLRNPPPLSEILALKQIDHAELIDAQHIRVHHQPEHDPAESIVEAAVAQQWGLFELTPERMSLEEIFVNITTEENHHHEETSA
jgi:ABC-2 type transport system ATP-binding protein